MRFMIIVKATPEADAAAVMPTEAEMATMAEYHEQLAKAGVLLDAAGLHATARGWRIAYDARGHKRVIDGPFTETKELVAGYTLIQVRSAEEALEWSRRFPSPFAHAECHIEVRQLFEADDFTQGDAVERFKAIDVLTSTPH